MLPMTSHLVTIATVSHQFFATMYQRDNQTATAAEYSNQPTFLYLALILFKAKAHV